MGLTVGLLFNLGKYDPPEEGEPPDIHAELDGEKTILAIRDGLTSAGHEVVMIEGDEGVFSKLREAKIDVAFNVCEGKRGQSRESHIPAILEMLGIPYTGSGVLALALSLDKPMAKRVLAYHNIPTPKFKVVPVGAKACPGRLRFPLFVKPAHEGSSMGVSPESVVRNVEELQARVAYAHKAYREPALVEEYLEGREFTLGILGNGRDTYLFPIMEINFGSCPPGHGKVYSYQFKTEWDGQEYYMCPAPVGPELAGVLRRYALAAYRALNCLDVARVDIRLNARGAPHVLEVNPLPGLVPGFSDLPRMATAAGMDYNELVKAILDCALERYGLGVSSWRVARLERRTA